MSAAVIMKRIREMSTRFRARLAGGLYLFTLLSAQFLESIFPGTFNRAAGILELVGMSAVTVVLYYIFRSVHRSISLLAAVFNFTGITLEAIRFNAHGTDIAMVFHGLFCILIGCLIFKSGFLPRSLGALIAFGGLAWCTYLTPSLANSLSPYNLACGLLGEASVFLWLLGMGINPELVQQHAGQAENLTRTTKLPSMADVANTQALP
jgi:hypothetical protein